MMNKLCTYLLLLCGTAWGQDKKFSLLFDKNSIALRQEETQKLEKEIKTLFNSPRTYKVNCIGHADCDGSEEANLKLSKERAEAVRTALTNFGVPAKNISVSWKGEKDPESSSDDEIGMQKNRRVVIEIAPLDVSISQLLKEAKKEEVFIINNQKGGQITSAAGTKISFEAGSFVFGNGEIVQGDVRLILIEYRNVKDFLLSGIPMSSLFGKGDFFNSGGMMRISAEQNGKSADLKEGKNAKVEFNLTQPGTYGIYNLDTSNNQWKDKGVKVKSNIPQVISPHGHGSRPECKYWYRSVSFDDTLLTAKCVQYTAKKFLSLKKQNRIIRSDCPWITFSKVDGKYAEPPRYKIEPVNMRRGIFKIVCPGKENGLAEMNNLYYRFDKKKSEKEFNQLSEIDWLLFSPSQRNEGGVEQEISLESNGTKRLLNVSVYKNKRCRGNRSKDAAGYIIAWDSYFRMNSEWLKYVNSCKSAESDYLRTKDSLCLYGDEDKIWHDSLNMIRFCLKEYAKMKNASDSADADKLIDKIFSTGEANAYTPEKFAADTAALTKYMISKIRFKLLIRASGRGNSLAQLKAIADTATGKHKEDLLKEIAAKEREEDAFKSFSIDKLGVWNCDQVERLVMPVYVNAKYKDAEGKELDFIKIYLVVSGLNGVIEYNGYLDLSPIYFPLEKMKPQYILGISADMKIYHLNEEAIKNALLEMKEKNIIFKCEEYKRGGENDPLVQK